MKKRWHKINVNQLEQRIEDAKVERCIDIMCEKLAKDAISNAHCMMAMMYGDGDMSIAKHKHLNNNSRRGVNRRHKAMVKYYSKKEEK